MVDHDILRSCLQERFIVTGKLLWFQSYLFSHTQYVSVDDGASLKHALLPQDSVLGPILYLLHTSLLSDIILLTHEWFSIISSVVFRLIIISFIRILW